MALRLALFVLFLLPLPSSAAVLQKKHPSTTIARKAPPPRKKSFFPNKYAARYRYRLLRHNTRAAVRFILITALVGIFLYGLLYLAYLNAGGIYGWVWGILFSSVGGVIMAVTAVVLIRWLLLGLGQLLLRLRIPAFRQRYRRCPRV